MNHRLRSMIAALGVARILLLIVTVAIAWPNTGSEDIPQVGDSIEDRLNGVVTRVELIRRDGFQGESSQLPDRDA